MCKREHMKFSKEIYTKEVVLKAAYAFTDCSYVHLDAEAENYIVSLIPREDLDIDLLYKKFENELVAQETRRIIAGQTKNIREIIVARALSSTIVNVAEETQEGAVEYDAEYILKNWFDENE